MNYSTIFMHAILKEKSNPDVTCADTNMDDIREDCRGRTGQGHRLSISNQPILLKSFSNIILRPIPPKTTYFNGGKKKIKGEKQPFQPVI